MRQEEATIITKNCINGDPATCSNACPFGLDLRSFLKKSAKGRWNAAYKEFRNSVIFPRIVAAMCPHPCQGSCQRTVLGDEPVSIGLIERACLDYSKKKEVSEYPIPPKEQKIAVIGAGVCGLTLALIMSQKKYAVTVFDRSSGWGGTLRSRPDFKVFEEDFSSQFTVLDTRFCFDTEIKSMSELDGYDIIYISTGSGGNDFGMIDSWNKDTLSTSDARIYIGGQVTGVDMMTGMAQGIKAANMIESYLLSGSTDYASEEFVEKCSHFLEHKNEPSVARVVPENGDFYTEAEAKAEAARCMDCDCDSCFTQCEMMIQYKKKPHKLATEVYLDSIARPRISATSATRAVYSCNECGRCKSKCPESVDIGDLVQLSRSSRLERNYYPPALHDYWLREMDFASGEASFASAPVGSDKCEYAFFPGCQLGACNPEYVFKSYDFLSENYNAGIILGCCGAPAYWGGDNARNEKNCQRILEQWQQLGKPTLVFACATCEREFEKFMPQIKRVSLYTLLAQSDKIAPKAIFDEASIFDPCSANASDGIKSAVKALASRSGTKLSDYDSDGFCCGYGGHITLANPELYNRLANKRAQESPLPYIVYCVNCHEVFSQRSKPCAHILDMVFDLEPCKNITLDEKRQNSLKVKKAILKKWGVDFTPETHPWDSYDVVIADDVLDTMEKKLITASDVRETIWTAQQDGSGFIDEDGNIACCMVKPALTYWVQYTCDGDKYLVSDVYCHRMHFRED
jgi:Fe-S oxidoreductase